MSQQGCVSEAGMNVASKTENSGALRIRVYQPVLENDAGRIVDVSIYEGQVPGFVASALETLYESVYCTLARINIYGEGENASTYVARAHGRILCVILYRVEGNTVKVVNQQITIGQDELREFARAIFSKYPSVRVISFYAIETRIDRFPFPFQKFPALEENVLTLPSTPAEYLASVSPALMKKIKAGERKLAREHPGFSFEVLSKTDVSEPVLREIIALAGARMASKQQSAYIDDEQAAKILRLVHAYGFVSVLRIDGVIRAGNIFYGVGKRFFMHVIAHDPDYDKYMLGHMVHYLAACYCIELGGRECCLMGGGRENKSRFRAFPKYLESVDIFRSRSQLLLDLRRVLSGSGRRLLRGARSNLLQLVEAEGRAGRIAASCLGFGRAAKQTWLRTASKRK
jgi:hypothetical protein